MSSYFNGCANFGAKNERDKYLSEKLPKIIYDSFLVGVCFYMMSDSGTPSFLRALIKYVEKFVDRIKYLQDFTHYFLIDKEKLPTKRFNRRA